MDIKLDKTLRKTSAMVLMLCAMSGCGGSSSQVVSSIFGETRTVPEGTAEIDFGHRHAPALNPGTVSNPKLPEAAPDSAAPYTAGASAATLPEPAAPSSASSPASNAYPPYATASGIPSGVNYGSGSPTASGRHVPVENTMAQNTMAPAVMSAPVASITASPMPPAPISTMPVTNYSSAAAMPASQQPSPASIAPAPVGTAMASSPSAVPAPVLKDLSAPAPASSVRDLSAEVHTPMAPAASAPPAPAPVTAPPPMPSAPTPQSNSGTPSPTLASVPSTPQVPSKDQNTSQFNALVADHDHAEAGREQLMGDQGATVMTSPKTGQLVDNAADAVAPAPQAAAPMPPATAPVAAATAPAAVAPAVNTANADTKNGGGFNAWLHNLFNGKSASPPAATASNTPGGTPGGNGAPVAGAMPAASGETNASPTATAETPAFQARDISSEDAKMPADQHNANNSSVSAPQLVDLTVHPSGSSPSSGQQAAAPATSAAAALADVAAPPALPVTPPSPASSDAIQQALQSGSVGKEVAPNVVLVNPQDDIASQPIAEGNAQASLANTAPPASGSTVQPFENMAQPSPANAAPPSAGNAAQSPVSAPVASLPPTLEPVHLVPPPDDGNGSGPQAASAATGLPDVSQLSNSRETPITLSPLASGGSTPMQSGNGSN